MLKRRKEIYEALHLETKAKVAGANASNAVQGKQHASEIISFASDTATKTGVTPRTIQQEIQIADKLLPWGRRALSASPLETQAPNGETLGLAKEVREQKQEEVQMLAEALLDAEEIIGAILKEIPKHLELIISERTVVSLQ